MEAIAKAKNVKISSQKAKLVMDLIRGLKYGQARELLRFTNKRSAGLIYKVLESARANAEQLAQQDNVLVDGTTGLCMVADGMGGHLAGEVASKLCVDTILARLSGVAQTPDTGIEALARTVRDAIEAANREIRINAHAAAERANMGTTVALLLPWKDKAIVAHVGDSRVYRLREGHLSPLTRDHSLLQEQVGAGFITHEEARNSHNRNLVTRALGVEDQVEPEMRVVDMHPGDIYLLCSDGLNTMVADADIEQVWRIWSQTGNG